MQNKYLHRFGFLFYFVVVVFFVVVGPPLTDGDKFNNHLCRNILFII